MKIVMANDHAGVELAKRFLDYFNGQGIVCKYLGTDTTESVDYPDMADKACKEFNRGGYDFGVLICGTGIGISIAANKHSGIVCALPLNSEVAKLSREHNAANFIAFGARVKYSEDMLEILKTFLSTKASDDERHIRRRKILFSAKGL